MLKDKRRKKLNAASWHFKVPEIGRTPSTITPHGATVWYLPGVPVNGVFCFVFVVFFVLFLLVLVVLVVVLVAFFLVVAVVALPLLLLPTGNSSPLL